MIFLPRVSSVPRAVHVHDHVVLATPVRHTLNRGVANHQIDHHDD